MSKNTKFDLKVSISLDINIFNKKFAIIRKIWKNLFIFSFLVLI
jgi:hypothetical protein